MSTYYNLLDTQRGDFVLNATTLAAIQGPQTRYLSLTDAKADSGIPLTAAAGTPAGAVGISRTAGTSLQLVGEATSSSAKTDKAFFEFNLPSTYVAGAAIPVVVNAIVTGSGTLTGASTTITVAAYTETNGVEAALTVSAAQQFDKTGETLTFTVTGTGLAPGQHVAVEITMLVTSASGANTGVINSVAIQA
jgi:hypothetical protein